MDLFLLGSCRIHRPIRRMMNHGVCNLLNRKDPLWFMHTSRAALQAVKFITGEMTPPLHLRELIFETPDDRIINFDGADMLIAADAILIEICSLNSIDIDGFEANFHRVKEAKKKDGLKTYKIKNYRYTIDTILKDIDEIYKKTEKPIMMVNHILPTGISNIDEPRTFLTEMLYEVSHKGGYALFDTSIILQGQPNEFALDGPNHYRKEFEPIIGEALINNLRDLIKSFSSPKKAMKN